MFSIQSIIFIRIYKMFCMLHDIFETPFFLAAYNVLLFVILVIVLTLTFSILSDKIFRSKILHNIAGGNDKEDYREDNVDYKKYVNVDEDIKYIKVGGKRNVKGGSVKYYYTIDKVETDINYEETKEELFIERVKEVIEKNIMGNRNINNPIEYLEKVEFYKKAEKRNGSIFVVINLLNEKNMDNEYGINTEKYNSLCKKSELVGKPIRFSYTHYNLDIIKINIDLQNYIGNNGSGMENRDYQEYVITHEFLHALGYDHQECTSKTAITIGDKKICPVMYQSTRGCPEGFECGKEPIESDFTSRISGYDKRWGF